MTKLLVGFILGTAMSAFALSFWPAPAFLEAPGLRFVPVAAAPATCATDLKGTTYYDTTGNNLCVCNGTSWVDVKDASTGCS